MDLYHYPHKRELVRLTPEGAAGGMDIPMLKCPSCGKVMSAISEAITGDSKIKPEDFWKPPWF